MACTQLQTQRGQNGTWGELDLALTAAQGSVRGPAGLRGKSFIQKSRWSWGPQASAKGRGEASNEPPADPGLPGQQTRGGHVLDGIVPGLGWEWDERSEAMTFRKGLCQKMS